MIIQDYLSNSIFNLILLVRHTETTLSPLVVWISVLSFVLLYTILWTTPTFEFQIGSLILLLLSLFIAAPSPWRILWQTLGLVVLIFAIQWLFSPFVREQLRNSLHAGFRWENWQYLVLALERFLFPLMVVQIFQQHIQRTEFILALLGLFAPLARIGVPLAQFRLTVVLAIKFLPELRAEWTRFQQLKMYFLSKLPPKSLMDRIRYWQGILKAMLAHVIQRSVRLGDALALRGLPHHALPMELAKESAWMLAGWVGAGMVFAVDVLFVGVLHEAVIWLWTISSVWMVIATGTAVKGIV